MEERKGQSMDKVYAGILGLVVGDALGVPVEFQKRGAFRVTDMTGYGTYNQPPGTWSDDSSLTLATLESLGRLGRIDPEDIMQNFVLWLEEGKFTPYGEVFDVGVGTRRAILRYADGTDAQACGGTSHMDNGNGALMRILPLAFLPHTPQEVRQVGRLTHAHEISQTACGLYIHLAEILLTGMPLQDAMASLAQLSPVTQTEEFRRIAWIGRLSRDEIRSSGYVVDTLEAALWCLWTTGNYRDCVLAAVNLGEDTDTVAAVAGGIAGLYYGTGGANGIPEEWMRQIPRREWIQGLCDGLERKMRV